MIREVGSRGNLRFSSSKLVTMTTMREVLEDCRILDILLDSKCLFIITIVVQVCVCIRVYVTFRYYSVICSDDYYGGGEDDDEERDHSDGWCDEDDDNDGRHLWMYLTDIQ